jgi:hypothetical protein
MLRVGDITLVMLLILLTPALFGSHCDAFHLSFILHLEGGYPAQGITYICSDREQNFQRAERKKNFCF